jgi:predicted Fe-Mo cluster-binding NifX family protein
MKMEGKKMKIAVASEKDMVTQHFGHCENFNIFEVKEDQIVSHEILANPGHSPGFLPNYLYEKGVNVIISGGMGGNAVNLFNERGIEVITGASGSSEAAVKSYLQGQLKSSGSVCHEHQHRGECGH